MEPHAGYGLHFSSFSNENVRLIVFLEFKEDFQKLVSNFRRIRFESTVGAGLPVISSVTRIIASGDPISRIVGSLSGTLGYVMSELEDGKKFSEVVKNAKSLGYTEPDPRDDLGGMDVARKC
ncbi:unnamed protein product [Miscanthus lutarioriparius]|uniref:Homoserine dehydrogenase n=1 Tax=Miscanthus lutarioriparius TaxID=422564 RepID=A0A811RF41_9POAL|nr:unnamed protein product [Miscanthus lutarioriparius]